MWKIHHSTILDTSDLKSFEIFQTLFYLSLKLMTLKEGDQDLKKEDISLEILSLYFLILTDDSNNDDNQQLQPQQLNLYHFT